MALTEGQIEVLSQSNRDTGNWLPQVNRCTHRAAPCGNAYCADEAMHAGELIHSKPGDAIASLQARQSLKTANHRATHCEVDRNQCPLENALEVERATALFLLYSTHSGSLPQTLDVIS